MSFNSGAGKTLALVHRELWRLPASKERAELLQTWLSPSQPEASWEWGNTEGTNAAI